MSLISLGLFIRKYYIVLCFWQINSPCLSVWFEQQPLLADFYPVRGPVSGGTSLTLVGFHLDAGVQSMMTLSDVADKMLLISCMFSDHRRSNNSVCVTSSASRPFNASIFQFTIDGSVVPHTVPPHGFSLLPDPTIRAVIPQQTIER